MAIEMAIEIIKYPYDSPILRSIGNYLKFFIFSIKD